MDGPLVGRDAALGALEAALAALARGRGGALLVLGDAGIGKTRLAEEAVARAEARGLRTAWATGWQDEGAPALWVWRAILRRLTGADDALRADGAPAVDASGAAAARFAQMEAVAAAVRQAAAPPGALVVLDDLHWADDASARLLAFVAGELRDAPCLVVATARAEELGPERLATLAPAVTVVELDPLGPHDVAALAGAILGAPIADELASRLAERGAGNPLFVTQMARLLQTGGRSEAAVAAIPAVVTGVVERRLARLPESTVALLRVAAVLGKRVDAALVARVAGRPVAEVDDAVRRAIDAGVLGPAPGAVGRTAFVHDVVREVAGQGLGAVEAMQVHAAAAAALAERTAVDPSLVPTVAGHLEAAGPAHADEAARRWEEAGRLAAGMLAFEEAAACFDRAASLADPYDAAALALAGAEATLLGGRLDAARARFERAATLARTAGDGGLLAAAVLGMGAGPAGWEVPAADPAHAALVEEAIARAPDDPALRAALLARLSVAVARPDEMTRAQTLAEEALAVAGGSGDDRAVALASTAVCDAFSAPEHAERRLETARRVVAAAAAAGDGGLALLGRRQAVVALLERGRLAEADDEIVAFAEGAARLRQPLYSWYVDLWRGMQALVRGDHDEAGRRVDAVTSTAQATGSTNAALLGLTLRLGIAGLGGPPVPAAVMAEVERLVPATSAGSTTALALALLWSGDRPGCERTFRAVLPLRVDRLERDGETLGTLMNLSRLATELGDTATGAVVHDLLLGHAGRWIVDGVGAVCWGPVEIELGRLALLLGRPDEAAEHLAAARAAVTAAGAPGLAAEIDRVGRSGAGARAVGAGGPNLWRRDGGVWTLGYAGRTVGARDSKGLRDLARLLGAPGVPVHVLELDGRGAERGGAAAAPALDDRARAAYGARLRDLEDEIDDADAAGDAGRSARAAAERDLLVDELSAALGLGRRARRPGDPAERARKAVGMRIKLAIDRLEGEHPDLARHLRASVRTGHWCTYEPERPTTWSV